MDVPYCHLPSARRKDTPTCVALTRQGTLWLAFCNGVYVIYVSPRTGIRRPEVNPVAFRTFAILSRRYQLRHPCLEKSRQSTECDLFYQIQKNDPRSIFSIFRPTKPASFLEAGSTHLGWTNTTPWRDHFVGGFAALRATPPACDGGARKSTSCCSSLAAPWIAVLRID